MSTYGTEATSFYGSAATARRAPQTSPDRSFEVVSGGGLDARAREGITLSQFQRFLTALGAIALVVVMAGMRIGLSTVTVSSLRANASLEAKIGAAQERCSSLQVERSVLSSADRITRIATENYGMVYTTDNVVVHIATPEELRESASKNAAQSIETTFGCDAAHQTYNATTPALSCK